MFSWRREPDTTTRERTIPAPLNSSANYSDFKNTSALQSFTSNGDTVPEFSRMATPGSVESLRKLVGSYPSRLSPVSLKAEEEHNDTAKMPVSHQLNNSSSDDRANVETETNLGTEIGLTHKTNSVSGAVSVTSAWIWSKIISNNNINRRYRYSSGASGVADDESTAERSQYATENTVISATNPSIERSERELNVEGKPLFRLFRSWSYEGPNKSDTSTDNTTIASVAAKKPAPSDILVSKDSTSSASCLTETSHGFTTPSLVLPKYETITCRNRFASLLWSDNQNEMVRAPARKPKRAVIVGVHGYFPARMTRRLLGEPTGTSAKLAHEAEKQLRRWMALRGEADSRVKIDKILLEGEGKIGSRVDILYQLLMEWRELVEQADFVFFAVHSQGAVVTTGIVNRLLENKIVNIDRQNVSILAMAGSWLGPMPGLDQMLIMKAITRIENDSLSELFELQNPKLPLSQQLQASLNHILHSGIKVILVGSVDDQLIPLYSALALNTKHPNLFRAVYIDGQDVIPSVISPLLQLATRQLNGGYSDHGVIVEISTALAGTLTSKGHSKLYNSDQVYDIAFRVALETRATQGLDAEFVEAFEIPQASTANPYRLPWSVQAIINDCREKKELQEVLAELIRQFKDWEPETKAMKDLKWRLVGLGHSKL